jgi:hypothetical protein
MIDRPDRQLTAEQQRLGLVSPEDACGLPTEMAGFPWRKGPCERPVGHYGLHFARDTRSRTDRVLTQLEGLAFLALGLGVCVLIPTAFDALGLALSRTGSALAVIVPQVAAACGAWLDHETGAWFGLVLTLLGGLVLINIWLYRKDQEHERQEQHRKVEREREAASFAAARRTDDEHLPF